MTLSSFSITDDVSTFSKERNTYALTDVHVFVLQNKN